MKISINCEELIFHEFQKIQKDVKFTIDPSEILWESSDDQALCTYNFLP